MAYKQHRTDVEAMRQRIPYVSWGVRHWALIVSEMVQKYAVFVLAMCFA